MSMLPTIRDLEEQRQRWSGVREYVAPDVDSDVVSERETRDYLDLVRSAGQKREEGRQLLLEADEAAAIREIRDELSATKAAAAVAGTKVAPARDAVDAALAALVPVDAAISRAEQAVSDFAAALSDCDPLDVDRFAALAKERSGYQDAVDRARAARNMPATALLAAQAELRQAQAAAAQALAAVDSVRSKLADPIRAVTGINRNAYVFRMCLELLVNASNGVAVHPADYEDAQTIIGMAAELCGLTARTRADERDRVSAELRRPAMLFGAATGR
jgi:hypothetical protein